MGDVVFHIGVNSDLADASVKYAANELMETYKDLPTILIASKADAVEAGRLAERYGYRVIISPVIQNEAWMLAGRHYAIYSEGVV